MLITESVFGSLNGGRIVHLYTLGNGKGMEVKIMNYGGIITSIITPDRKGNLADVVLGFEDFPSYLGAHPYFGAIIGRYANRIAKGNYLLNGTEYEHAVNNGPNHLHGGIEGFDKKLWTPSTEKNSDAVSLILAYESAHMEVGYPGNLLVETVYTLNQENELIIEYRGKSDRDTPINMTNHSYFNLTGGNRDIKDHLLKLNCSFYTPVDGSSIPTGEVLSVSGTPFDFREGKTIGRDLDNLEIGYDHNFVIDRRDSGPTWFAQLEEPESGRKMEVAATTPGVQVYTSYYLENLIGKNQLLYQPFSAICLETQHFPDSPNKKHFPDVILRKDMEYYQKTIYKFSY